MTSRQKAVGSRQTSLADRLRAELTKAQVRIFELEAERDRFGGAWSSAEHAASGYRHQRDEVVRALADLVEVVGLTVANEPTLVDLREALALMAARQIVERYRPRSDAMIPANTPGTEQHG